MGRHAAWVLLVVAGCSTGVEIPDASSTSATSATSSSSSSSGGGSGGIDLPGGSGGTPCEPANVELPNQADDDCDGLVDEVEPPCDDDLAVDDFDAANGARALGICTTVADDGFGLVSASYVRADGSVVTPTPQVGLLAGFGPNVPVEEGARMLALSSGHARDKSDPDYCDPVACDAPTGLGQAPSGFPQPVTGCPATGAVNDDIALELALRAPHNATGYRFLLRYYSVDFPISLCREYDDQLVAVVDPEPPGSFLGNIAIAPNGEPLTAVLPWLDVCDLATLPTFGAGCATTQSPTCPPPPNPYCPAGPAELAGTGFDDDQAGATPWLVAAAPVEPGSDVTIRFAIWDSSDWFYDSTVLLDAFAWVADPEVVVGLARLR
jgi:hypothetical protein